MLVELWWGDLLKGGSLEDKQRDRNRNIMLNWTEGRFVGWIVVADRLRVVPDGLLWY